MKWLFSKLPGLLPNLILKVCFLIVLALMAAMALISDYNRHPDEIQHFEAAKYYTNHFFPPEIGDPVARESYSPFGDSYLNYHWAEYFFAGKFAFLISPLISNQLIATRFFNIFLLISLAAFLLYKARDDYQELILPGFLLISPQIWYVFSYINNDGFALFVSILAAYQMAARNSLLNRFLNSDGFFKNAAGGLFFGLLLGFLLTAKTNYYAFLLFAALWLLYNTPPLKITLPFPTVNFNLFGKYVFIFAIAVSVLTFRCATDYYINGETNFAGLSYLNYFAGDFEKKKSRLLEYKEAIAEMPYKPSTIEKNLMNSDPSMKLKEKGTSYAEIFTKWYWHAISFRSLVGVYGYLNLFAPDLYYRLMFSLYAAFGLYLTISILLSRRLESIIQLLITASASFFTIFISSYLSWVYAFQAQGRYLFPIIGMLALLVYANRQHLSKIAIGIFIAGAFLLSVYSFIFVGLAQINAR
ncbi:MAG TPA: hypothetical protein VEX64_01010 [Pyrinomonadaceae bacterium]|nr:hypothetical protein [Pyrinomonadaceae bacterium]